MHTLFLTTESHGVDTEEPSAAKGLSPTLQSFSDGTPTALHGLIKLKNSADVIKCSNALHLEPCNSVDNSVLPRG
jgi:hypothetical protein